MPPEQAENPDADKPIQERLASKSWGTRAEAFKEIAAKFKQAPPNCANDEFRDYASKWPTFLLDSNPGSLLEALEALAAFLDKASKDLVGQCQMPVIKVLLLKCLGHAKPQVKAKSLECALLTFEIAENFTTEMVDSLEDCYKNSKPPQQITFVSLLAHLLTCYGVKKFPVQRFSGMIESMANQTGLPARTEATNCYKAIYLWVGDTVLTLIEGLKPLYQETVKNELKDHKEKNPTFKRLTRSEQAKQSKGQVEEVKEEVIDVYDLSAPKNILKTYNQDWIEVANGLKTWTEKRDKLQSLISDADVPKLEPGSYIDLVGLLKKLLNDSHIMVNQMATKVLGLLAKGLREQFKDLAKECFPILVQKLKERRLVDEIQTTFSNFLQSADLNEFSDSLQAGLTDKKSPVIQKHCAIFLENQLPSTYIDVLESMQSDLLKCLVTMTEEKDTETRDQGLKTLGILLGRLGPTMLAKYTDGVIPQKKTKIEEAAAIVVPSKYDKPQKKEAVAKVEAPKKKVAAAKALPKQSQSMDEQPANQFDDAPIKAKAVDYSNAMDDMPIKAKAVDYSNAMDDIPIKAKAVDYSNAMDDAEMLEQPKPALKKPPPNIGKKPVPKPKIQQSTEEPDEQPIQATPSNQFDDAPIRAKAVDYSNAMDEMPISSNKVDYSSSALDEQPLKQMKQNAYMTEDADMTEQPKPPVVKKPPPNIGKKPEPKPKAEVAKPAAKPVAKGAAAAGEEDESGGLSKEEAIEKVESFYSAECVAKFEEAKWQDKVEGFKEMQAQIEELKPDSVMIEATARFIKVKLKDWKESNMNIMKEAVETFKKIIECCDRIPKRALWVYAPFLCDKIGDVKFSSNVKEILTQLAEFVTAKFVALQVIKYATTAKAPNNLKESCNILTAMFDEWGAGMMPVKECIDYATLSANNPNVQIRNASMQLFAMLFKHLGETIRNYLSDIKESTMKLIEEEFKKITPLKKGEFKSSKMMKGEASEEQQPTASFEDSLPREDITKALTSKLLAGFKDKDWKKRKDTADAIVEILKAAKMRIMPAGLQDLMENLKTGMKESNKAVIKSNIQLMGFLAEATGAPLKLYTKKCLVPLIFNLSDKQSLVRNDVIECMNKWSEAIGPEQVVQFTCSQLEIVNPELREEGLKWIVAHKEGVKGADHSLMVKPLVDCLLDKMAKIRQMAEEIIVEVMTYTGFEPFSKVCKDLLTAVQQAVRPILEKAKAKCGSAMPSSVDPKEELKQAPVPKRPQTAIPSGPTLKQPPQTPKPSGPTLKSSLVQSEIPEPPQTSRATFQAPSTKLDDEQLIVNAGNKERRSLLDAKSKWLFEDIKPEQVDKVKHVAEQLFGLEFMQKMFSSDFKKHNIVLKELAELIATQPQNLKDTLDIIIKWSCIKLTESQNTSFAMSVFDFYQQVFEFLIVDNYQLLDTEAAILIPVLCDKVGLNNAILKDKAKKLLQQLFCIYDMKKTVQLIIKFGIGAKNLRSVAECLEELTTYVKDSGLDNITEKDLQQITKMVDNNDKGVRENALTFIAEVYLKLDEEVWRVLGPLNIKVKGLLEARFKQIKKGSAGLTNLMNRSINQPDVRKSIAPMNKSLNKSMNKSINAPQTPNRAAPVTTKNSQMNSLTKSIKQEMNQSGGVNSSKMLQPTQTMPAASTTRQPLKFQSTTQDQQIVMKDTKMVFDDDDDDLREQLNEIQTVIDPKIKEQVDFVMKHIQSLKYGDLTKRVDSLVALNDVIGRIVQYKEAIIKCSNELCSAFTHVMVDVFERQLSDIPLRFAKYFVTIVHRVCQSQEVMMTANQKETYELTEQMLVRLLTENLDKLGDQKEGEVITKTLNAAMLRLLENCQPTLIYCSLYQLMRKYKDYTVLPKLPGLVIKCLLKLAKIIEKQTGKLEIDKVLVSIHEYLIVINHDDKSQNDEMGIRITKTVINELVKIQGESIWVSYQAVEHHNKQDNHIQRWIMLCLNTSSRDVPPSFGETPKNDREIKQILDELRSTDLFEGAIAKLHAYLIKHPDDNLNTHLKDLSQHFANFIRSHLEQYQNGLVETGATPEPQEDPKQTGVRRMSPFQQQRSAQQESRVQQPSQLIKPQFNSSGSTGRAPATAPTQVPETSDQRISQYQDKIASMKDRLQKSGSSSNLPVEKPLEPKSYQKQTSMLPQASKFTSSLLQTGVSKDKAATFSQMNSSLSQKWKQISSNKPEPAQSQPQETTAAELAQIKAQNQMASGAQATQSDLQTRLAEMKAKLQLINKKKE